jgi:hypothetical protein
MSTHAASFVQNLLCGLDLLSKSNFLKLHPR